MTHAECPVIRRAAGLSVKLKRALHRLQKGFESCRGCALAGECETAERVQEWVEQAAQEVLDELSR